MSVQVGKEAELGDSSQTPCPAREPTGSPPAPLTDSLLPRSAPPGPEPAAPVTRNGHHEQVTSLLPDRRNTSQPWRLHHG